MEMEFVLVSVRTTRLEGIGLIAKRNVETAAQLYARKIECKPEQLVCISRRKVGMHAFWAVLNIYASLRSTSQGVCMLDGAPIPLGVMMKNFEHERKLDDPQGYISAGYRIRNKANNLVDYYIKSRGIKGVENMGRRVPRDVGRTNIVVETNIGLRKRKQKRFSQASLMRKIRGFPTSPWG